ncbi:hypothetical protein [Bacillus sp. SG-1]|uniref:hypothetical protein n=1 Tax=Bacillus sp. SG-1 TaxID=161544 RepID=UPI000154481B|nr:hypothetical protein [Bacillus sp. SG-1]EDL62775.1 hypothetical protein BSG1_06701 [Bacillus sp. SG-1]
MIQRASIFIFASAILFCTTDTPVLANGPSNQSGEDIYREIGYTSAEEAVREAENHFNQELKLPLRVPPIQFTHILGRFNDLDGEENDSFEMKYINEKTTDNHYKINIRPIQQKFQYKKEEVIKTIKLKDGNEAVYLDHSGFNVLVFEKENWQYMLSINKKVSELMLPGTLVKIANSIDAPED